MPSLRAKFFNSFIRLILRKRKWGEDENGLTRRARRRFGAPWFVQQLIVMGLDVMRVDEGALRGEWISPKKAASGPRIFYIHGGGFVSCSPRTHRPITATLARFTGLRVFAVEYPLAPAKRYPAALDDVYEAYKKLRFKGDVILAGDSAGGGLVLSLLMRIRDEKLARPLCAMCFSPWADLTARVQDCVNAEIDAMFFPDNFEEFAAVYSGMSPVTDPLISPLFADADGLPPVLFQVSSTEILLEDSRRMHEKILAAGGESELQVFDSLPHCWQMLVYLTPEAGEALTKASEFMRTFTTETQRR